MRIVYLLAMAFLGGCGGAAVDPDAGARDAEPDATALDATAFDAGLDGGGLDGGGLDGGGAFLPRDVADEVAPYALADNCAALPSWPAPPVGGLYRVAALDASEAVVIASYVPTPSSDGGGQLLHMRRDGTYAGTSFDGVHDVWTCGDEVWAVGSSGLVLRRMPGGDFVVVELGIETTCCPASVASTSCGSAPEIACSWSSAV